ncbi:hypothetical protein FPOA_09217 [Fusarium poae]|uniref:Uncharacterized protein n=1 Tax=Fusarium poae TaxID=36050 RepID=A0A1B8ARB1_FUSPO|nr:hypothetical protein FPOA_09217 [Fusarium poae]
MVDELSLLGLPGEVRAKIYHYYFQVDGGYAYDAECDKLQTVDNRPIELSLLYTCRTIAREARHLPFSLNAIEFRTLYRPELNNLAGCFNLVATTYQTLESELVLLLASAGALTPEMRDQLAMQFPDFGSQLARSLPIYEHKHEYYTQNPTYYGDRIRDRYTSRLPDPDPSVSSLRQLRSTLCHQTQDALAESASVLYLSSGFYRGFSRIKRPYSGDYPSWSHSFWKAEKTLSSALQLLATQKPADFERQIGKNFPQWDGSYRPDEFLNLRFDHWAIPSPSKVKHAMDLLAIGDVWHLPGMWYDARSCCAGDDRYEMCPIIQPHPHHPVASGVQCREKIRFSAVANAIRFLETRLSSEQRRDIRSLVLIEDFPSVNSPSAHAQGLATFYRENPHLRVERRVDLMGCMFPAVASPTYVANYLRNPDTYPGGSETYDRGIRSRITQWLLDALAVTDVGIPAEAFTLVLQAGCYKDLFTDLFQQHIHNEIAWHRAFKALHPHINIDGPVNWRYLIIQDVLMDTQEASALETLANGTSPILRSDFNSGVAHEIDTIINDTSHFEPHEWIHAWNSAKGNLEQAIHRVDYNTRLSDNFEIRIT